MAKLIKKGQQGVQLSKTIHLKKEGDEPDFPNNELQSWLPDIRPEERMDLTVQELSNGLSTYKPTKDLEEAGTHTKHPFGWQDVAGTIPLFIAAAPFLLEGVQLTGAALLSNPIGTTVTLGKDVVGYAAANAISLKLTGQGVADNINDVLYLPKGHPLGELAGFTGTSLLRRPLEKIGETAYKASRGAIQPKYALSLAMDLALEKPYVSRVVGENGKIRLRLPNHSDKMPREIVLEPLGNNKFYVHIRTWNDVEGKVPANLTPREIGYLYESLYDELPEGAEILFPKSGPGNYATRGTVAGLQRLTRDPRYKPGLSGTLWYLDKDGTVKEFTGTGFIKLSPTDPSHTILYTPTVTNTDAPNFTPLGKNYFIHNLDKVEIIEDQYGPSIILRNQEGKHIGGIDLQDVEGLFHVIMVNSTYPGGSGPLYNAAIKYGLLKYGDLFKGVISGETLVFPEKTTKVTSRFPNQLVHNRGAYGGSYDTPFRFGPVIRLTDQSTYYPQLPMTLTEDTFDKLYFEAINQGNFALALKLRDLHFITKGGEDINVFGHTSHDDFLKFDKSHFGKTDEGYHGKGFYFSTTRIPEDPSVYKITKGPHGEIPYSNYGPIKKYFYLKGNREFNVGNPNRNFFEEPNTVGITGENLKGAHEVIIGNPRHIKSADAITYDDNGNIIPLSKRDNFSSEEYRYSWLLPLLPFLYPVVKQE